MFSTHRRASPQMAAEPGSSKLVNLVFSMHILCLIQIRARAVGRLASWMQLITKGIVSARRMIGNVYCLISLQGSCSYVSNFTCKTNINERCGKKVIICNPTTRNPSCKWNVASHYFRDTKTRIILLSIHRCLAPFCLRKDLVSTIWPIPADSDHAKGEVSVSSMEFTLAPFSTRSITASNAPYSAAQERGVRLFWSQSSTGTPV